MNVEFCQVLSWIYWDDNVVTVFLFVDMVHRIGWFAFVEPSLWHWNQSSSVARSNPTLCDFMDCSIPGLPVHRQILEFTQTLEFMSIELVMPSNHLILCCPLLLPPSIFSSIRVFSNESVLHIRLPEYWSFSFSTSPSNKHTGLISFIMDWLDLLAIQGTLKSSPKPCWNKSNLIMMCTPFCVLLSSVCKYFLENFYISIKGT